MYGKLRAGVDAVDGLLSSLGVDHACSAQGLHQSEARVLDHALLRESVHGDVAPHGRVVRDVLVCLRAGRYVVQFGRSILHCCIVRHLRSKKRKGGGGELE